MKDFFTELKRRNVIRVAIFYATGSWLVVQAAGPLLELIAAPDGSLRVIAFLLVLGFPFALILAWAFEITPEGIKREHEVDRSDPVAAERAGRKLDLATIVLLVVAIGLLIWQNTRGPGQPGEALPMAGAPLDLSIAVLPFVNMSPDPANEYFSEGLSEEVLNTLARMEDFRVAGRTSSFAFKGQQQDLRAIGERLGVANILEGSVRKQGEQVRVTAQLIDARSGYHLWSETYSRRLDDIFAIQDDIATEVVRALRKALLPGDEEVIGQTAKGDVEAYNHYLRGQYHVRLRTREGLDRALEEFQQAILIDPDYAPPYAGIAMVYALFDNYGYRSLSETETLAHRALDRALALDPSSDEAWAVRGLVLGQGPGAQQRRDEAREALQRAVEINPNNALAQLWLTNTLFPDAQAADAALHRAYELDPLSPVIVFRRAMRAVQTGDEAGKARYLAELKDIAPDWFITWQALGNIAQEEGRIADAAIALERAVALNPEYAPSMGLLGSVLAMLGQDERAEQMLVEAEARLGGSALKIQLAAHRTRMALRRDGVEAGLGILRPVVEALEAPRLDQVGDLALLELSAGDFESAERRIREAMGFEPDEVPEALEFDNMTGYIVLVVALRQRGEEEATAKISGLLREQLRQLREEGTNLDFMPLVEGYLDELEGEPGGTFEGFRRAVDQGLRLPPGNVRWILAGSVPEEQIEEMERMMSEALSEERERYRRLRAEGA
jgi:TolB-like protein/Flp pilus assembly protein TadD